jgi:hypothetical protein
MKKEFPRYKILDTPTEGLDSKRTLEEYVKNTDYIIGRLDGSIPPRDNVYSIDQDLFEKRGTVFFTKQESKDIPCAQKPDIVLWLDKSARPVSWMVQELWDQLASRNEDGSIADKPQSWFLNIDRFPWLRASGLGNKEIASGVPGQFDINSIGTDAAPVKRQIGWIRGIFVDDKRQDQDGNVITLTEENFDQEVWNMPLRCTKNNQSPQSLMIVDEVKSSGDTLSIAQQLLSAAFPELVVTRAYWQNDKRATSIKGASINKDGWVPVWYDENTAAGRGVGEVSLAWYQNSNRNWRHKLGAFVLSTPAVVSDAKTGDRKVDSRSLALRLDIKELSRSLLKNEIVYIPSPQRSNEMRVERIHDIAGMNLENWRKLRDKVADRSSNTKKRKGSSKITKSAR